MEKKPIDLGLTALDELFMTDEGRKENKLPRIHDIPLSEIDDMPDHPYKVRMDEDMEALVESVKNHGIITPVILRKKRMAAMNVRLDIDAGKLLSWQA